MLKSRLIKAITLILFVTSLTAFVAYRGGYISMTNSTATSSASEEVEQDSIPFKMDSLKDKTWMYSSKSIILTKPFKKSDSIQRARTRKKILMMSGSKSGAVFVIDSIQIDSMNPRPIKKRK
ncbi:MAG: hypothetical protein ACK5RG_08045 [Cyclobacteriaceae bacterium]|jgi:hypothetical protein|nr:hypothetical protein [Flammeovirgaceae bacterium]